MFDNVSFAFLWSYFDHTSLVGTVYYTSVFMNPERVKEGTHCIRPIHTAVIMGGSTEKEAVAIALACYELKRHRL
jgi:hypothetical protein